MDDIITARFWYSQSCWQCAAFEQLRDIPEGSAGEYFCQDIRLQSVIAKAKARGYDHIAGSSVWPGAPWKKRCPLWAKKHSRDATKNEKAFLYVSYTDQFLNLVQSRMAQDEMPSFSESSSSTFSMSPTEEPDEDP